VYNIGTKYRETNLEIAHLVLEILNKPKSLIKFVPDRLGHDFRYALNWQKISKLGWRPKYKFADALRETIKWYIRNEWWWKPLWRK